MPIGLKFGGWCSNCAHWAWILLAIPPAVNQLTAVPDLLLPEMLQPFLRGTMFGEHIHHFYRVGSTNTVATEAAASGAPEGSVFLAPAADCRAGAR